MLQIYGSMQSAAIIFSFFIGLTGFVLFVAPVILKIKINRAWNFILGSANLAFALLIILKMNGLRMDIYVIIVYWMLFNAIAELIEAGILFLRKNAFFALFGIHFLLSLLMGSGFYNLIGNIDEQRLFNMGLIALVFGLVNELSAYMLSIKKPE